MAPAHSRKRDTKHRDFEEVRAAPRVPEKEPDEPSVLFDQFTRALCFAPVCPAADLWARSAPARRGRRYGPNHRRGGAENWLRRVIPCALTDTAGRRLSARDCVMRRRCS